MADTPNQNPLTGRLEAILAKVPGGLAVAAELEQLVRETYLFAAEQRHHPVKVGDVVQFDASHEDACPWGPLLATVHEVRAWGIIAHVLIPAARGEPPDVAPMRVEHKHYVRIGTAEWIVGT